MAGRNAIKTLEDVGLGSTSWFDNWSIFVGADCIQAIQSTNATTERWIIDNSLLFYFPCHDKIMDIVLFT
ncbi:hypothetical protein [Sporosarcina sp. BP05]|uniref:hypothetical protein n=1 Tax=Sporosarcina sp. BP05 TaxID=2758726 RepID=UPI0016442D44|nr:hypothetical protein [Sporosarcina sp. BP05]